MSCYEPVLVRCSWLQRHTLCEGSNPCVAVCHDFQSVHVLHMGIHVRSGPASGTVFTRSVR